VILWRGHKVTAAQLARLVAFEGLEFGLETWDESPATDPDAMTQREFDKVNGEASKLWDREKKKIEALRKRKLATAAATQMMEGGPGLPTIVGDDWPD
jgi:hypothetical protein